MIGVLGNTLSKCKESLGRMHSHRGRDGLCFAECSTGILFLSFQKLISGRNVTDFFGAPEKAESYWVFQVAPNFEPESNEVICDDELRARDE
jgi:hypothetical protein